MKTLKLLVVFGLMLLMATVAECYGQDSYSTNRFPINPIENPPDTNTNTNDAFPYEVVLSASKITNGVRIEWGSTNYITNIFSYVTIRTDIIPLLIIIPPTNYARFFYVVYLMSDNALINKNVWLEFPYINHKSITNYTKTERGYCDEIKCEVYSPYFTNDAGKVLCVDEYLSRFIKVKTFFSKYPKLLYYY